MNGAATQIASHGFDQDLRKLPAAVQDSIQKKIDDMGLHLGVFPHHRVVGSDQSRLRVGDYRLIYRFDVALGEIYLVAVGHRREIYRH